MILTNINDLNVEIAAKHHVLRAVNQFLRLVYNTRITKSLKIEQTLKLN